MSVYTAGRIVLAATLLLPVAGTIVYHRVAYRQDWLADRHRQVIAARRAVAPIAAQPGPALCQDLLLCNWADTPFVVDLFNYTQSVRLGARGDVLQGLIARHAFGAIQLDCLDGPLPGGLLSAIDHAYAPVADIPGLYLPRPRRAAP
jgi:hypothetical protein